MAGSPSWKRSGRSNPMKDVVIVGAGPVGLFAALLLDQQGISVDLYERWPTFYPLPRACGVDHEIIRQLQGLGLMDELEPLLDPVMGPGKNYEFQDANHETLLKIDWNRPGASGWAQMNMFYQPEVEAMMLRRLQKSDNVSIHHGRELVAFEQHDEHVQLTFAETEKPENRFTANARYVIGADGARSTLRGLMGIKPIDLGFAYDWLVVDVVPHDKIVVVGFSQGGGMALDAGTCSTPDVKAVVSLAGVLTVGDCSKEASGQAASVLIVYNDGDPVVRPDRIQAFQEQVAKDGYESKLETYAGTTHWPIPAGLRLAQDFIVAQLGGK